MQTACISLVPSHVPQCQAFHTELSYLMFNLPPTKNSQQRKTAKTHKNARPPDTAELRLKAVSTAIFILRSKQYYRVVAILMSLDDCIFASFEVNCEVMPLRSFATFKLKSRHRKELCGALGHVLLVYA